MPESNVYSLLIQAFHADKSAARLLHALQELAGRLEVCAAAATWRTMLSPTVQQHELLKAAAEGVDAALRFQDSRTCSDLSNLPLPDPALGPLSLLPNACEHAALQAAAQASSCSLTSTAERRAWRSWVMLPQHMVHVVEAAWLLVALMFRQEDACAAAVQAHVCQQIQRHHVSAVLTGQEPVQGCSNLWTQTLADAACKLLRAAFPTAHELNDKHLQQVLQRQLRLYTTGLLPSDSASPALRAAQHKACSPANTADDTSAAADVPSSSAAFQRASCAGAGGVSCMQDASQQRRQTAYFVSIKPGPAVSGFIAQQGLQPAPDLLQAHAGELTRITLPAHLVQQQQQQQQQQAADSTSTAAGLQNKHALPTSSLAAQASRRSGVTTGVASSSGASHKAKAAACMSAASEAVETYEKRKAAAAASVKAASLSAQVAVRTLAKQKAKAVALGPSKARETSNRVSGWLTEAGAATTCMAVKAPSATSSKGLGSPNATGSKPPSCKANAAAKGIGISSSSSSSSHPLPTDTQCKEQRQLLENQLKAGDWRVAHAFNGALHDKCTNMAAAVATLPPAPITPMPPSAAEAIKGQDWGALVSINVARHHARGAGLGLRSASGSSIKVMKAARAIVEDVQKAFAASGNPPPGKSRH